MNIRTKNLTKIYKNRSKGKPDVTAVGDFTFEIPDGELVALLGPSGCGKSTMLNMISGLETPTRGQIFFGDTEVTQMSPEQRGVGMVFQNYALYPHLTVEQNIRFPLENFKGEKKLSREEMAKRVKDAAALVQIENYMERKPSELSGGQQQRVAIARALVKQPEVLLLDEPLSNLDARLRLQTREEIRRIQRETGITMVFVTHDQDEAMSISDRIVVMKEGYLQQMDQPQKVYEHPTNLFVAKFLGTPPINVFHGKVENHCLLICNEVVLKINAPDGDYHVAIRPEGFMPDEKGPFTCGLGRVETMGRDTSIVFSHPAAESDSLRAMIRTEERPADGKNVRFTLKPAKVHLFAKDTENLASFEVIQ